VADRDDLGVAGMARVHFAACRRIDHADDRHTFAYQCNVDREVRPPAYEFARAVERIDQDERIAQRSRYGTRGDLLLRDAGDVGVFATENFEDQPFAGMVGRRDRRLVGLDGRNDLGVIDIHDQLAGLHGQPLEDR
jgi:hypothetical protein